MDKTNLNYDISIFTNATLSLKNDLSLWANLLVSAIWRDAIDSTGDLSFKGKKGYPRPETVNDFDLISLIGNNIYIYIFQLLLPVFLTVFA